MGVIYQLHGNDVLLRNTFEIQKHFTQKLWDGAKVIEIILAKVELLTA